MMCRKRNLMKEPPVDDVGFKAQFGLIPKRAKVVSAQITAVSPRNHDRLGVAVGNSRNRATAAADKLQDRAAMSAGKTSQHLPLNR